MQIEYKEIYANDKPELTELVQEWVDENNSYIYRIWEQKDIKYKCR